MKLTNNDNVTVKQLRLKLAGAVAFTALLFCALGAPRQVAGTGSETATQLGRRLFADHRFSTTKGDLPASCNDCHLLDENPQGIRAHADFLNRSWVSFRIGDPRREELRNSPTLFDVGQMRRLHFDGEFASLEELVKGTLSGRPMGWLAGERDEAFEQIHRVVVSERAYIEQFKLAYGVQLERLNQDQVVDLVARAISAYMRSLVSDRSTLYDQFVKANGLETEPSPSEAVGTFAARFLARLSSLESGGNLRMPSGFGRQALEGLKTFFRTEGSSSVGNCISCHAPPLFTDLSFHNIGISQVEYDRAHGEGSFARLPIPDAATAVRPSVQFREAPSKARPGYVDLGHWNFVDLKASSLRRPGEGDRQFLQRMIATFKTPTLRHLVYTQPYMHNGAYPMLEDALTELARLSEMARAGRIREADNELMRINISASDIPPLVAFLATLSQELARR